MDGHHAGLPSSIAGIAPVVEAGVEGDRKSEFCAEDPEKETMMAETFEKARCTLRSTVVAPDAMDRLN